MKIEEEIQKLVDEDQIQEALLTLDANEAKIHDKAWYYLSLIHISEPTRQAEISYAVFCLKKKKNKKRTHTEPSYV